MATQIKTGLPSGEFIVIDNSTAGATSTNVTAYSAGSGGPPTGGGAGNLTGSGVPNFDNTAPGAGSQGSNPFGNTGSTTLDTVNDTVYANPRVATLKGNPNSGTQPTYATVSTVLNSSASTRLLWKNPA